MTNETDAGHLKLIIGGIGADIHKRSNTAELIAGKHEGCTMTLPRIEKLMLACHVIHQGVLMLMDQFDPEGNPNDKCVYIPEGQEADSILSSIELLSELSEMIVLHDD